LAFKKKILHIKKKILKLSTGHNGGARFETKLIDAHIHLSDAKHAKNKGTLVADADNASVIPLVFDSMDCKPV